VTKIDSRGKRLPVEDAHDVVSATELYYEKHAAEYFERTVSANMSHLYERFLPALPVGGRILDVGCGSGRDLRAFTERGFHAIGIDASRALVEIAKSYSGAHCYVGRIEEIDYEKGFDGIWACASLVHFPRQMLLGVLRRLNRTLVPMGVMFASVQEGKDERTGGDGRFFTFYRRSEFVGVIHEAGFKVLDAWKSEDALPRRRQARWINVLACRSG
jgi:SAM-dependent methyltransferase